MSLKVSKLLLTSIALSLLAGCSAMPELDGMLPDRKVEYKKSRSAEKNLEVPPDLSSSTISDDLVIPGSMGSGSATYSDFANRGATTASSGITGSVIPQLEDIKVQRNGDQRWLVIKASPDDVWNRVIDFWQENGILMAEQDPSIGVMVTSWIENRADIKSDFITDYVRKIFDSAYSAATRDQYRVRMERGGEEGTVELFLTHRGMQEELVPSSAAGSSERAVWTPRESDHGLEAEMLRRLMVHLGVADQKASKSLASKGPAASERSLLNRTSDQVSLSVKEELERAWRLIGVALDRVGFAVEDRNRTDSVYYVRYIDPMKDEEDTGLLSKLVFWKDDKNIDKENRYQVKLSSDGDDTKIVILNEAGARDNSPTAVRILTLLHEQIR